MFQSRCPNCGRRTARTEDWVCQWCGYPLLSRAFRKINKTFAQLKGENQPSPPEDEPAYEPPPPEISSASTDSITEATPEPRPSPEVIIEPEPAPEMAAQIEAIPPNNPPPAAETSQPEESIPEASAIPEPPSEVNSLETESVPTSPEITLTIEELLSIYEQEGEAADAKLANRKLRLTGTVGRVEVNEDINYVILTNEEQDMLQTVRCNFARQYGAQLSQLSRGQPITIQGDYDGTIIDIRLQKCCLII